MKVVFPALYYELISTSAHQEKMSHSTLFTCQNPLRSRELGVTAFLEAMLSDEVYLQPELTIIQLFVRHHSGERVEIINSCNYGHLEDCIIGLKRELELFEMEKLSVGNVAVFNSKNPHLITILCAGYQNLENLRKLGMDLMIGKEIHVFHRNKKCNLMLA